MNVLEKFKLFIINPKGGFDSIKKEQPGDYIKYFFFIELIPVLILTIISILKTPLTLKYFIGSLFVFVVFYFIYLLFAAIGGIWMHLWTYIFGGRKGLDNSLKIYFYSATPFFLFFVSFIQDNLIRAVAIAAIYIWISVIEFFGLKKLQKLNSIRSVLVIIFSNGIFLFILLHGILIS